MRILYFSSRECWPLNTGARLRDYHFARQLAQRAEVSYYGMRNRNDPPSEAIPAEAGLHEQLIVEKGASFSPTKLVRGLFGPAPVTLLNCENRRAKSALETLLKKTHFDSVQIEGVHLTRYVPAIRELSPHSAIVCDWHNIESEIMRRYGQTASGWPRKLYAYRTAGLIENMELRLLQSCDVHTVASQRELERLRQREPKAVLAAVGNGVDVETYSSAEIEAAWNRLDTANRPAERSVLFVGSMDYHANIDGCLEFARYVWPRVKAAEERKNPGRGGEFVIAGRNPAPEIKALGAKPGIRVTGTVSDIRPYYRGALALVVPLRIGSGTRLKILEAMAVGVPVVSTRLGAEGLAVKHRENILLAETTDEFLKAIQDLDERNPLRETVVEGGRRLVVDDYDWPLLGEKLFQVHVAAVRRRREATKT